MPSEVAAGKSAWGSGVSFDGEDDGIDRDDSAFLLGVAAPTFLSNENMRNTEINRIRRCNHIEESTTSFFGNNRLKTSNKQKEWYWCRLNLCVFKIIEFFGMC